MSRASPQMRQFSQHLIAHEDHENNPSGSKVPGAFHTCEKLRPQLATLMGSAGFRALLLRALALASPEVSWLRAVHVKSDGSLDGLEELETQVDPREMAEGKVILLAQLLGLLVAFIGENLTIQMVREVWPKLPLEDLDFDGDIET